MPYNYGGQRKRFMELRPPHGGGIARHRSNRLTHQTRALVITPAQKKAQAGFYVGPPGHRVYVRGPAHTHFLVQQRRKKVIKYRSPGYGLGRGHGHHAHGYHLSAATRAKISAALKGRKHPHRGHAQSQATRGRISAGIKAYYATHPGAGHSRAVKGAATRRARGIKPFGRR